MPRSKCQSALMSIRSQIAIFGLRNRSRHTFRLWRYSARSNDKSLIYDGSRGRKGGSRPRLVRGWRRSLRQNVRLGGGGSAGFPPVAVERRGDHDPDHNGAAQTGLYSLNRQALVENGG
ncbi:hypothetical protein NK6_6094 [Bradyrhizobium diazoefficiens]|uniref:Uncharacterized protein n=2 Tax=Bradyrhizobium diazoefficiens TaxID=1355477 RepID=A0A837CDC9_9BRAD|nr:hypothetical protein BJA5080_03936 [Bradyrhizobium diazoefficiens SEMIA 5080]BAR59248.1 hypothetical protein NK6_6094 [Bradyrhizobium diazoefficiens]